MVVCSFFLRGQCKFGQNCKNEHPADGQRQGGFGNQTWTNRAANAQEEPPTLPFSRELMTKDLTPQVDKPIWPLSSYGPAKHEPTLITGLDVSPEELRFNAFTASRAGNINDYLKYESDKITAAEQAFTNARNNIGQAYDQAVKQSSLPALLAGTSAGTAGSAFGAKPSASSTSAFGNPLNTSSTFGASSTSNFGKSAFGQPAFGQRAFGQTTTPAVTTSAFGQPSSTSAFGQPQKTSAFGQTSTPQSSLIKPATGAFGSLSNTTSGAFGGGGGFSAFAGQPSAFGLGAGANASTPQTTGGSVFGQPSLGAPATQTTQTSTFGNSTPMQSAFGGGARSVFGQPQGPTPAFGKSAFSTDTAASGQPGSGSAFRTEVGTSGNPFTGTDNQAVNPFVSQTNQPTSAFASIRETPQPTFNIASQPSSGLVSQVKPPPSGPPDFLNATSTYRPGLTPYDQLPDNYINMIPPMAIEAFRSERFEWGKVPDWIPPKEVR